jgi:hypothetical protein
MPLSDLAALGSFVSGVAVLISLIYLAVQVRQAERNQRAIVQQARISRSSDQLFRLADPPIAKAWLKGMGATQELTEEEYFQCVLVFTAMVRSVEDVYFQHDLGLLDASSLENQLGPLRNVLRGRGGVALWKTVRDGYDVKFAMRIDSLISAQLTTGDYLPSATWKTELAKLAI